MWKKLVAMQGPIMYDVKHRKIQGRWNKKEYTVIRRLGSGGVGEIYQVSCNKQGLMAIKLSRDMLSITKEYNWMKKYKGRNYVPAVYDLDDCELNGCMYHFFTMEYISGYDLSKAIKKNMPLRLKLQLFAIILEIIWDINKDGLIYSDLKQENIMVDRRNSLIRLVDFGSITEIGLGIKEYTPMYDRAYWGFGRRFADASYQSFSAAILLILMLTGKKVDANKNKLEDIHILLRKNKVPKDIIDLVERCIKGSIDNCGMFYDELIKLPYMELKHKCNVNLILYSIMIVLFILLGALIFVFVL